MKNSKRKNRHAVKKINQSETKIWLFRLISFSIPVLFFVLLEITLRIMDYGQTLELFMPVPDSQNYLVTRPDIIKRYFSSGQNIPNVTMETNFFLKQKPLDAIRIFVQGGSTAAGFPYGLGASPAGMLDQRLKKTFPKRHVEVINTAMSAVSSYVLVDFVDEIIAQKPDAILIYAGHNEFLGILGVGSSYSIVNSYAANSLFLRLRKYRTVQLIKNIIFYFSSNKKTKTNAANGGKQLIPDKRTMMAKVAKNKIIKKNSVIYRQGLDQFRNNLDLILSQYQQANIPVFISTLVSNQKDQPPFSSKVITKKIQKRINSLFTELKSPPTTPYFNAELTELAQIATQGKNASLHYQLAKLYQENKQFEQAKQHYQQAKEHDLLRFRAPESINQIIKQLAKKHQATLVDYQSNLARSSNNGIIGNEFMLEHLHPNLPGYFILADSFYQKLKAEGLFGNWKQAVPTPLAWKERPIIPAEEYAGYAKIVQLKSDYPFTSKKKKVILTKPADWQQGLGMKYFSKEIDWLAMLNQSYQGYLKEKNIPMLLKTSQMIADAMPQNAAVNFRVGKQLMQENQAKQAARFFARALREEPNNNQYQKALANSKIQ